MSRSPTALPTAVSSVRGVRLAAGAVALTLTVGLLAAGSPQAAPAVSDDVELAAAGSRHSLTQLTSNAQLLAGTRQGVAVADGSVRLARPVETRSLAGKRWHVGRWTSGWVTPQHSFTELIPSWEATTPAGTFVEVRARVASTTGTSGWKLMGRWTGRETLVKRTSAGSQGDRIASVSTDAVRAASRVSLRRYQLQVELLRQTTNKRTPTLRGVAAVASALGAVPATSRPAMGARTLAVPRYSQMVHRGRYPQYGGGGQAWCSPTSLAMVLGYHRKLPPAATYRWVNGSYSDRVVPHLARSVYDHGYRGAGNWAFNTAWAATRTGGAFVTRLSTLRDAEGFIASGIPLVASISFGSGQLRGAPISRTNGHLVVIAGFTGTGDVVVNDPAAPTNASVRRVYDRGQFERAWQGKSRGLVYVIHSADKPLPQHRRAG